MEYEDDIYGTISIPKDISRIIETPQFQRLKKIKQLGLSYLFIPEAIHTRFDHSIGTYHLARRMINSIEKNTSWIKEIPKSYKKAIEIAALLHDIGHGPFSHFWEHIKSGRCHEENSFACVDKILEFEIPDFNNNQAYYIELIKALIVGDKTRFSRTFPHKFDFLFEIVNNKKCYVDVDKWDYLNRDYKIVRRLVNLDMDFDDVFLGIKTNSRKNITDITSDDVEEFLQLTDDKILSLIKPRSLLEKCLVGEAKLVECHPATDDEKTQIPLYLKALIHIKLAGDQMPEDDLFSFFGDPKDQTIVQRERGTYEICSYFTFTEDIL